jgi:hypothetical protein
MLELPVESFLADGDGALLPARATGREWVARVALALSATAIYPAPAAKSARPVRHPSARVRWVQLIYSTSSRAKRRLLFRDSDFADVVHHIARLGQIAAGTSVVM